METTIKLLWNTKDFTETTIFNWNNYTKKLEFKEIILDEKEFGISSSKEDEYLTLDEYDKDIVKLYIENYGEDLLKYAKVLNGTIYLKKEIWLYNNAGITESWLEADDAIMFKKNTKIDFYNLIERTNCINI